MRKLAIVIIFSCLGMAAFAQKEHRFEKEIAAYEQQDRQHAPLKGGIVFTGSSSIRMWKDLNDRFEGYNIIPRGFGGSQLSDVIYLADRILIPYRSEEHTSELQLLMRIPYT